MIEQAIVEKVQLSVVV